MTDKEEITLTMYLTLTGEIGPAQDFAAWYQDIRDGSDAGELAFQYALGCAKAYAQGFSEAVQAIIRGDMSVLHNNMGVN